jgi:hypothetical protein
MSAWLDMAEAIKTRLESLVLMDGVDVIVDRQKDINTLVATAVAKIKGAGITILWETGDIAVRSKRISLSTYSIRVYGRPILNPDGVPADDLTEAAMAALQDWYPSAYLRCQDKMEVSQAAELIPHKSLIIYEFEVRCRVNLPDIQFNPPTP